MKQLLITVLISALLSLGLQAAEPISLEYPELMVSPRASDRITMEAKKEKRYSAKYLHLPMQVSALATLVAGALQFSNVDKSKDADSYSPLIGVAVGGLWLTTTFLLSRNYMPYKSAHKVLKKLPKKTKREHLIRERLAEEHINAAASLGKKLTWMSVITNLGASAYMMANTKSETMSIPMNAISIIASFAPVLFTYKWNKVDCDQKNYKKKIYGPIAFNTLLVTPKNKIAPGLLVSFSF